MKRLSLLKLITSVLFAISCIALFFTYPFILVVVIMPQQIPFKLGGLTATELGIEQILLLVALAASFSFYTYALYLFKKVLTLFEKKKIFHEDVTRNLYQAGKAVLIGFLVYIGSGFIYSLTAKSHLGFELSYYTFFIPMLGLFFMVLSDVFAKAKAMKEESDLTV